MYHVPDFAQNPPPGYIPGTTMYGIPHASYITEHSSNANNLNDSSLTDITVLKNKRYIDERVIEKFCEEEINDNHKKIKRNSFKIAMVKDALVSISILNRKIDTNVEEMRNNPTLSKSDWQDKLETCNAAKAQISAILSHIKQDDLLNSVKRDLDKRKKKRLREKNQKVKWKNEKLMRTERRNRLDEEANAWIRSKQVIIEKEKQEENLRRHADIILSDVRSKRNDAKKFLGILQGLQTLRNVKTNIAIARGESLSSAASEVFNNIIGKLKEQWAALDREYSLEEQGLKLMLKTDNEQKLQDQKKKILHNWETVLFGNKLTTSHPFHQDINNFLMIRSAWDKFINSNDADASPIPIGWIMPDKPSSAAWQKLLTKD